MPECSEENAVRWALYGELKHLRAMVHNARNILVGWSHGEHCSADPHTECGPVERNHDGTMGGAWCCHEGLPREECERQLQDNCDCGMYRLRAALEVNRG